MKISTHYVCDMHFQYNQALLKTVSVLLSAQEEIGPVIIGKGSHIECTNNFFILEDIIKSYAQKVLKSSNNRFTIDRKQQFSSRKMVHIK